MKKWTAAVLSAILVFVMTMGSVSADTALPNDVRSILSHVKTVFSIDDTDKTFTYSTTDNSDYGISGYDFSWEDNETGDWTEVRTDKSGRILSYNGRGADDENTDGIPALSKSQAVDIAYKKIQTIFPEAISEISRDKVWISNTYYGYIINFDRYIDGVQVKDNILTIGINAQTQQIIYYNGTEWVSNVAAPTNAAMLSGKEIISYFQKNMPLTLQYVSVYNNKTEKYDIRLVYAATDRSVGKYLDARTGEVVSIQPNWKLMGGMGGYATEDATDSETTFNNLSDAELAEIETHNQLISKEQALNTLKGMSALDFDTTSTVSSINVNSVESMYDDSYTYDVQLWMQNGGGESSSANFDGQSGRLTYFSSYDYTDDENKKINVSYAEAEKTAKNFLQTYEKSWYENAQQIELDRQENMGNYYFSFNRVVNGVLFPENYMSVCVDAKTGKITSFYSNWEDAAKFEDASGVIGVNAAVEKDISYFGANYIYVPVVENEDGDWEEASCYSTQYDKAAFIPVYSYVGDARVDAKTGAVVNSAMEPYEKVDTYMNLEGMYPQLEGHYCKSYALKLFDMDITLQNKDFQPNDAISEEEFDNLLSQINRWNNQYQWSTSSSSDEEIKAASLTRMQAVKKIVEKLGYDKLAQKSEIFTCGFDDVAAIGAENVGYVAIVKGLGICRGSNNQFMPARTLTYADAIIMVYNSLNA